MCTASKFKVDGSCQVSNDETELFAALEDFVPPTLCLQPVPRGFRFSWLANDTRIQRPTGSEPGFISWESISGLKNYGSVTFESIENEDSRTRMDLKFQFKAPRVVSGLFRRSGRLRRYTEEVLLMEMLEGFRDVVVEEDLR